MSVQYGAQVGCGPKWDYLVCRTFAQILSKPSHGYNNSTLLNTMERILFEHNIYPDMADSCLVEKLTTILMYEQCNRSNVECENCFRQMNAEYKTDVVRPYENGTSNFAPDEVHESLRYLDFTNPIRGRM